VGLSFPQVLHDHISSREDAISVREGEPFDILLVTNGGSHFKNVPQTRWQRLMALIGNSPSILYGLGYLGFWKKIGVYQRLSIRNIAYEQRVERLMSQNPGSKMVHRLDDRYQLLCKCYGFDQSVLHMNKQFASATVYQSHYCQQVWEQGTDSIFGPLTPLQPVNPVLIANGVDRSVFSAEGRRLQLAGKIKILHVAATGMPRKGLRRVLEIAELLSANPDIHFYLVGRQTEDPICGRDIGKFRNVTHLGFTHHREELAAIYRACDILLFPSVKDCSPNVVLEAMSCGLPVVAEDSGGTPELIIKKDLQAGALIQPQNPILALKTIIDHLDTFKQLAMEIVKRYHSSDIMGENYVSLFKEIHNR
jgi:glycosyltransferase involved in cell wall biosynthesis